jgi:hypothetical protein
MAERPDDRSSANQTDAVHQLAAAVERVADSLTHIEALYASAARQQAEDRAEARERQKRFDAEQEDFKERQKRWDAREAKWDSDGLTKSPWLWPGQISNLILMVALAAMAVAVLVLARR